MLHVKYPIETYAYIITVLITKTHVVHSHLTGKGVGAHGGGRALVMRGQVQWGGQWLYQEANRPMVLISLYKSVLLYSATFCANNSILILFLFFYWDYHFATFAFDCDAILKLCIFGRMECRDLHNYNVVSRNLNHQYRADRSCRKNL